MSVSVPILDPLHDHLLVTHPGAWMLRLTYVVPVSLAAMVIAWIFPMGFTIIPTERLPDPGNYAFSLLLATFGLSLYWVYLQIRQREIAAYRADWQGSGALAGYFLCLLLMNAAPFAFAYQLYHQIANAFLGWPISEIERMWAGGYHPSEYIFYNALAISELDINASGYIDIGDNSHIFDGDSPYRYHDRSFFVGFFERGLLVIYALILFELSLAIWLLRSIAFKSLLRALAVALCTALLVGMTLAVMNAGTTEVVIAFFPFYIAAFVLMIRGARQSRRSGLTTDATVIFVLATPFAAGFVSLGLDMESERQVVTAVFVAIVGLLAFSPIIQRLLNRLRALPA